MSFTFYDYERPTPFDQPKLKVKDSFRLPIPNRLSETQGARWEAKDGGLLGELANIAAQSQKEATVNSQGEMVTQTEGTGGRAIVQGMYRRLAIAKLLPGDLEKHVEQRVGAIMNPHLTQFFNGPEFQSFNFQWRFHPRSPQESDIIKDMLRMFKRNMLPARAIKDVSSFLAYPSMVQVQIHPAEAYYFRPKLCVIKNCNIDYAPMGGLMTFEGTKAPRVIEFGVTLEAIEYFLSEEFGGTSKYQDGKTFGRAVEDKFNTAVDNLTGVAKDAVKDIKGFIGGL